MTQIVVLGSSGLLGSEVLLEAGRRNVPVLGLSRSCNPMIQDMLFEPSILFESFGIGKGDLVVNAIGVTKQKMEVKSSGDANIPWINSQFPGLLAMAGRNLGATVLQIGTDCVFSGARGLYRENDKHDATDAYGLSKSEGERSPGLKVIRSSFVGPSERNNLDLWGWVKTREINSPVTGFTNHLWNGVTTTAIARVVVSGFIQGFEFSDLHHFIPEGFVTKSELVKLIARRMGRLDLNVIDGESPQAKDMRLATLDLELNRELWLLAGYSSPPTLPQLIADVSS